MGARSLWSEIVGLLKSHALSIFQITDIPGDLFLNPDARAASEELVALRTNNEFLFAAEEAFPGSLKIQRYCRSQSLVWVSPSIYYRH